MLQIILRSLLITSAVSCIVAYFLTTFEVPFWKSFLLATITQVIVWNVFTYVHTRRVQIRLAEIETEALAEAAKQSSTATCAYCNTDNIIPIRFDVPNNFECNNCNKENSVYVAIETAQLTAPVNTAKFTNE